MTNKPSFAIRGVIEGFYGVFYTAPERDELIRFIGQHGLNTYIYAPKNDRYQRTRWWEPYPEKLFKQLAHSPEASKIPLLTFAEYANDPQGYDPQAAWERAVVSVCGSESAEAFKPFAAYNLASCLGEIEPEAPQRWTVEALDELRQGVPVLLSPKLKTLKAYLGELGDALYHLQYGMDNLALRTDLLPWIELMETWKRMALEAIRALVAGEEGEDPSHHLNLMEEYLQEIKRHPKHASGIPFLPLAEYALSVLKPAAEMI